MNRRDRLRRTGCQLLIVLAIALGIARAFGAFGDPMQADGGLMAVVLLAGLGMGLYPHPETREERPHGRNPRGQ